MKCGICGRKLKNRESREIGYGPVCYKRRFGMPPPRKTKGQNDEKADPEEYSIPGQMEITDYI